MRHSCSCSVPLARGFTLLELLVVMALLGVATLFAAGGAEPLVRAARERGWMDRLQAELIKTRNATRASGTVGIVSFLPEEGEVRFASGSRTSQMALPSGLRIEAAAGIDEQAQTVVFFPDGTASEFELVLISRAGRATRLRVIGITGKIEITRLEPPA
jgi:general secretion pathway protein H